VNSVEGYSGRLKLDLTVGEGAVKVESRINGELLNEIAVRDFDNLQFDISHLQAGTYDITITVYDRFLNENSQTMSVNYTSVHSEKLRAPEAAVLHQNYPNPFNQETQIAFDLDRESEVDLRIYSIRGNLVRILAESETRKPGANFVKWNGKDGRGRDVPSGIYLCTLKTEGLQKTRSLLLLR
jgi:hypothetical protein